jgi:glycosyltransferase involved in cell wall biosynthesis
MKVLQLCNKPPYPPVDGGTMAMNSITQGLLSQGCDVTVLTVKTDKHPVNERLMADDYRQKTHFESVYIDLGLKTLPAAMAMLCGESYHVKRYISSDFAAKLREILEREQFDIVHIESIFLTPYVPLIRKLSNARVLLRAHNVEHLIWKKVAQSCRNPLKRWYLKHLSLTLRAYEMEHLADYDGIICITDNDADYFRQNGCRKPVVAIPFGIEPEELDSVDVEPDSLFHIGAMDWLPNQESIQWLLDEIWPVVHREVPQAKLYLAGRKMPERWKQASIDGVSVIGEVPDAMYFINSKKINIVPLLSGSGIRVKIIEAMSIGKVVITTSVGAQGIHYTDGENILIANTPQEFAQQIKRCLDDDILCQNIGKAAAHLIATQYDEALLTDRLLAFYNKQMEQQ